MLLPGHGKAEGVEEALEHLLEAGWRAADVQNAGGRLVHLGDVELCQGRNVPAGVGVGGDEDLRLHALHIVQGGEIGLHVDEKGDLVLFERRLAGKAVGKVDGAVRRPEAGHVKGVARQGHELPARASGTSGWTSLSWAMRNLWRRSRGGFPP